MPAQNIVYFGSAKQNKNDAAETLPGKLDRLIEHLRIKERVKDKTVAIKMHLGGNIGYSTIHPVFVRKVVSAVWQGGGRPFITDTPWAVRTAHERGYSHDTLGCELLPAGGPDEKYMKRIPVRYKNVKEWTVAGTFTDADFLIDFAHIKGHPSTGFGGVFKNLALGGVTWHTRSAMHDACHWDRYFFPDKVKDRAHLKRIIKSCPFNAISHDKNDAKALHLHVEQCNQCMRCQKVAKGALRIQPVNFHSFQEACALSVKNVLSFFPPEHRVFISLATMMTPLCDCFGFTGPSVLPDLGLFGGNDICAVETAVLDAIGHMKLIEEFVPGCMEIQRSPRGLHPFQQLHGRYKDPYLVVRFGEQLGLGRSAYRLVNVMDGKPTAIKAKHISSRNL